MARINAFFFAVFLLSATLAGAQPLKRELRAAWIATVSNIDWPSRPGLPAVEQQQEFTRRLDDLKALGCNAVMVQIRPAADAFYASKMEPWSRFLTGRQGEAPFPYYDPLVFMIDEAHKRNMEFHAWFNPFRALTDSKQNPNPPSHVTRTHPDWIVSYGGKSYIDPGIPEAREYVLQVIGDVVKRYNIDGVHLDDYFYPYRVPGAPFNDNKSFAKYGQGMNRDDWRRNNVNLFISQLNTNIKNAKSWVKFGVSPFGVWRNARQDAEGSNTTAGQTCYDDLYSDVVLWMQRGWVDYLMPQLYWEHNHKAAAFNTLLPWWSQRCYRRHVYFGLGVYRMTEHPGGVWRSSNELLWQLRDIRKQCGEANPGYCFYSASCFDKIGQSLKDSLRMVYARYPAIPPAMPWIDSIAPAAPVVKGADLNGAYQLKWEEKNPSKEPLKYIVYRFTENERINLERADRILAIQQSTDYTDADARNYKQCTYIVTALDRTWNESQPGNRVGKGIPATGK